MLRFYETFFKILRRLFVHKAGRLGLLNLVVELKDYGDSFITNTQLSCYVDREVSLRICYTV